MDVKEEIKGIGKVDLGFDIKPLLAALAVLIVTSGILIFYLRAESNYKRIESYFKKLKLYFLAVHLLDNIRFESVRDLAKGIDPFRVDEEKVLYKRLQDNPDAKEFSYKELKEILHSFYLGGVKKFGENE